MLWVWTFALGAAASAIAGLAGYPLVALPIVALPLLAVALVCQWARPHARSGRVDSP